jgi:tetratricopeptide (TPR) repeat protein
VADDLVRELCQVSTSEEFLDWRRNHEITDELINELMLAVRRLLDSAQFDSANRLSDWCLALTIDLKDLMAQARASVTKGIVLSRANSNSKALEYLDQAIHLYEEAGDEFSAAKVRVNRIECYRHLSRYGDALRDGEMSTEVFARLGEKQLLARALNNLGSVFFQLDRFQEWLSTLERAGKLLQEIGDSKSLAMVYMNHAIALRSLNRRAEAIEYFKLSRKLAQESGQEWLASMSNYNLGYLHYTQGEYTHALDVLTETRSFLSLDQWLISLCDLTQSEIYLEINMYRDAIQFAETAYKGFESIGKPFEMAKAIGVQAVAHSQLREFKDAGRLFQLARAMFKEQGNEVRAAGMDLYRGVMWLQMGLNADARSVARTAYDAFMKESVKPKAAFARIVSARASLRLSDLEEASDEASLAKTLNDESPLPSVSHQLHAVLGEIDQARNNLPSARDEFLRAITELEDVRSHIAADELRLNYLKDKVPVYEMLIHTDLRLGDAAHLEEAFETAERAKSRTLVDLLAGSVDPLKQASSSSFEDIRQTLAPDAVLVEYVMIRDSVVVFCVARDRFDVIQNVCSKAELKKTFGFLQFHLSRFPSDPAAKIRPEMALANIQAHLKTLYGMLVRPIEHVLSG